MDTLIVGDEPGALTKIQTYLVNQGHKVHEARSSQLSAQNAAEHDYDALVIDVTTPRMDGLTLIRQLRDAGQSDVPIIVLSGRASLSEKLDYFRSGADDYLAAPYEAAELEARMAVLARRNRRPSDPLMKVGDLHFHPHTLKVEREGRSIKLCPTGLTLLRILMRETHRVVRRSELESAVWGEDVPTSDALRTHIASLRSAIDKPFGRALLHTIHGIGYRLADACA